MHRSIENKIRLNAVLVWLVLALICCGLIVYVLKLGKDIREQKDRLEVYQNQLLWSNDFVNAVNQAQMSANQYVATRRVRYLREFHENLSQVKMSIDNPALLPDDSSRQIMLQEIGDLLSEKGRIVAGLNNAFDKQNPVEGIRRELESYSPPLPRDSIVVSRIRKDTLVNLSPKRSFLQRLGDAFSPKQKTDTLVSTYTLKVDTIRMLQTDTIPVIVRMNEMTRQANEDYLTQIRSIEDQVNNLLLADQNISAKISELLIEFYNRTVRTVMFQIRESDHLARRNNTYSMVGSGVALLLTLLLIYLIILDVNKGYAARRELEKSNERIRQVMESRHTLLLSVSHDIKTPLNSILGYLELWDENNPPQPAEIKTMQNSGKLILSMLDNLLGFSALEQGRLQVQQETFNPRGVCVEIVEMMRPLALRKNLNFDYSINFSDDLHLCSDSLKIRQIIQNLLSNAVKYTESGGVELIVRYDGARLLIEVNDTGVGIPAGQLGTLFAPFARVEANNRLAEGTGLGLYVVKGLVDLLNGNLHIDSVPGKGTSFRIALPAASVELGSAVLILPEGRLLIVDDDPAFLRMMGDMAQKLGRSAQLCHTELELRACLPCLEEYAAVLTDLDMGGFSGTDVLRMVRDVNAVIPIVIMTAKSGFRQNEAHAMGFNSFLAKPVSLQSLANLLGKKDLPVFWNASLLEMFDGDDEAVREVTEVFRESTRENIVLLRQAIADDRFDEAQAICHKMLPMFIQMGLKQYVPVLRKMDSLRGQGPEEFPEWKEETMKIMMNEE